ncbi:MAG: hypothetical protein ACI8T1_003642 [Verrucomicrobiales bacterium]|jgi:hypothetical protein
MDAQSIDVRIFGNLGWDLHKPGISPVSLVQAFGMGAFFDDAPPIEDEDAIGVPECGKTVRDGNCGSAFDQNFQGFLNTLLSFGIDVTRGFIEHENLGIVEKSSGD